MLKREYKQSSRVYVGRTRLERPKPRAPKKPFSKILYWVLLGLLTGAILCSFFWLPAIRIQTVVVSGTRIEDPKEIEELAKKHLEGSYFFAVPQNSIFLYPAHDIVSEILEAYPRIGSVDVEYRSATSIIVRVTERTPQALWCGKKASCVFLDASGYAFARAPHFSGAVFFEVGASSTEPAIREMVLPQGEFPRVAAFAADLETLLARTLPDFGAPVGVVLGSENSYSYRVLYPDTTSEWNLIISREAEPAELLKNIQLALVSLDEQSRKSGKKLLYLDARLGQKLFSKFKE